VRTVQPVIAALDLLDRRQALRMNCELEERPPRVQPLQRRCDYMSSSVLQIRLTEPEEAGLVQRTNGTGYVLTAIGHRLRASSLPLTNWQALR
jgi:DNA-binding HxlR family transcriptional regulator